MENIVIKGLSKAYGEKQVLKDFSAELTRGRTTAVMAPSGRGKTTLLRILMGLEKADSGTVYGLSGSKISAVFQEDRLCENLTPCANIRLVNPSLSDEEIQSAMNAVCLTGCNKQPVRELSGGMKRRVSILRALLCDWDLLLMDEPFKGLDENTKTAVLHYVLNKCSGRTVLFITHITEEAAALNCEKIIEM